MDTIQLAVFREEVCSPPGMRTQDQARTNAQVDLVTLRAAPNFQKYSGNPALAVRWATLPAGSDMLPGHTQLPVTNDKGRQATSSVIQCFFLLKWCPVLEMLSVLSNSWVASFETAHDNLQRYSRGRRRNRGSAGTVGR